MENVTRALILAFSMIMFVVSFSFSMFLINKLTTTSKILLETITTTNYYDNIEFENDSEDKFPGTRKVGIDTIIPVLYRYSKENYAVKILDDSGNIIQVFDLSLENKVHDAEGDSTVPDTDTKNLKNSIYNDKTKDAYLSGAPWVGNSEHIKARIDYFLNGTSGYINNVLVDYSGKGFIAKYSGRIFEESFVEYAYEGETISTENGLETITGSTQENSKIIITYKLLR